MCSFDPAWRASFYDFGGSARKRGQDRRLQTSEDFIRCAKRGVQVVADKSEADAENAGAGEADQPKTENRDLGKGRNGGLLGDDDTQNPTLVEGVADTRLFALVNV